MTATAYITNDLGLFLLNPSPNANNLYFTIEEIGLTQINYKKDIVVIPKNGCFCQHPFNVMKMTGMCSDLDAERKCYGDMASWNICANNKKHERVKVVDHSDPIHVTEGDTIVFLFDIRGNKPNKKDYSNPKQYADDLKKFWEDQVGYLITVKRHKTDGK